MQKRLLGKTGLNISILGFGCGAVGGLMVGGAAGDQEQAVARAVDLGVNYFDTAPMYGNGASERNLGRTLSVLRRDVIVATKARVDPATRGKIGSAIVASAEASLQRLRRDSVDIFQLHTPVTLAGDDVALGFQSVLDEVIPAFAELQQQGKIRFCGFAGTGDPAMLPRLIDTGAFAVAQLIYNVINPSAAGGTMSGVLGPDFANVLTRAQHAGIGTVAIRVLAGGALSGSDLRHALGSPVVAPMGSGRDYGSDVEYARRLLPLLSEGRVATLVEAALRFAISNTAVSTALVGFSDLAQIGVAADAVEKGPLPSATLERIAQLYGRF